MIVEHVEVLVEEPSMREVLLSLIPRLMPNSTPRFYLSKSKQDLLKELPKRLRAYSKYLPDTSRILVIVDRDDDDCTLLKKRLETISRAAGLATRSSPQTDQYHVVNRIVVEELEAWYFGDWEAVRTAYPRVPKTIPQKATFRNPDDIKGGTREAFERVLQKAGYYQAGLPKLEAARRIGPHLDPARSRSASFRCLCTALSEMAQAQSDRPAQPDQSMLRNPDEEHNS